MELEQLVLRPFEASQLEWVGKNPVMSVSGCFRLAWSHTTNERTNAFHEF